MTRPDQLPNLGVAAPTQPAAADYDAPPETSAPDRFAADVSAPSISPVDFAQNVLQVKLWGKQVEILNALAENRRVAVKSGNGVGKGFCAAIAVLWFLYAHDQAVVLTTAPTFRQVRDLLWRQIHALHRKTERRNPGALGGDLLKTRWELDDDRFALGLSSKGADQFQGFHSPNILVVVDEAEGVSEEIFEGIEAVMTSENPRLLLIGNPTTLTGAFRRAFYQERDIYHCVTISVLETPNVAAESVVFPGLVHKFWVEERKRAWGEDNPIYRSRVLGEFPTQEENTLIPLPHIETATKDTEAIETIPSSSTGESKNGAETHRSRAGGNLEPAQAHYNPAHPEPAEGRGASIISSLYMWESQNGAENRRSRVGGNLDPTQAHYNPAHPEPVEGPSQTRRSRVGGNLDPTQVHYNPAHPELVEGRGAPLIPSLSIEESKNGAETRRSRVGGNLEPTQAHYNPAHPELVEGRDPPPERPDDLVIAVDVARYGPDRSVILRRRGSHVQEIQAFRNLDTMELTGRVAAAIRRHRPNHTSIDEVGIGAGVVDRLREQRYDIHGVNVAHNAIQHKIFANLRAEGYWKLRMLFANGQITIPRDEELISELASLRYGYDSRGRVLVESKKDIKQRGLPSPDKADALMLAFLPPPARPRFWI